jgi:hypothetical protein
MSWVRVSSLSGSFSVGWGWKTCANCLSKTCAFSALHHVQVPCVVLTGGEDLVTCFIFLVTFRRWQ